MIQKRGIKPIIFTFILAVSFKAGSSQSAYPQIEKSTLQAGVSGMPVFDLLGLFPGNNISGAAFFGSFGTFVTPRLCFGINPYYGSVANTYESGAANRHLERQDISLAGLNTYIRYYYFKGNRFLLFVFASAGFGNLSDKITDLSTHEPVRDGVSNNSVYTYLAGVGFNYRFSRHLAVDLNVPYTGMHYFSKNTGNYDFRGVVPSLGLQVFW